MAMALGWNISHGSVMLAKTELVKRQNKNECKKSRSKKTNKLFQRYYCLAKIKAPKYNDYDYKLDKALTCGCLF